jgi:hypothetical protein
MTTEEATTTNDFDWDALRAMWVEHADLAVATMAKQYPDETFYVLVFMLDEDLNGPMIAINSLEGVGIDADARAGDFYDRQWSPFEWGVRAHVDFRDPRGDNVRLYGALQDYAKDGTRDHWRAVHAREQELIVKVAQIVAERARMRLGAFADLKMADDFVVFARERDVRWPYIRARRSIAPAVLQRFFAKDIDLERQRLAIAAKPESERIAYLVSRLGTLDAPVSSEEAGEQLVALGAAAVPALVALLDETHDTDDRTDANDIGWKAAMHLSQIGAPAAEPAASALLAAAKRRRHTARWAKTALGKLGRFDDLVELEDGAGGLVAGAPRSLPYLEALLDAAEGKAFTSIAEALGRVSSRPRPEDFEVVVAHVASKHEPIRKYVALALGNRELGSARVARAVPLLIALLGDEASEVRRLAALALERLRGDAVSAVPRLRELQDDKGRLVADTAKRAIAEILWKPRNADG